MRFARNCLLKNNFEREFTLTENFIYPLDLKQSRPFHFVEESTPVDVRIGGNMPDGLSVRLHEGARYFGTFPIYDEISRLYFSIFINCSFANFIKALNRGFQTDDRIVVAIHESLPRSTSAKYGSGLSQHAIHIDAVGADLIQSDTGETVVREGHKFGGSPYSIQKPVLPGSEALFLKGYKQVLQVDFPSPSDGRVSGSWPFGDGIFNLFWKDPFEKEHYHWYLQG